MQERNMFTNLLKRLVHDTENNKFQTSEQVIKVLVDELSTNYPGKNKIDTSDGILK